MQVSENIRIERIENGFLIKVGVMYDKDKIYSFGTWEEATEFLGNHEPKTVEVKDEDYDIYG